MGISGFMWLRDVVIGILLLNGLSHCQVANTSDVSSLQVLSNKVLCNQVAYSPTSEKMVLLNTDASDFQIKDQGGKIVFTGPIEPWMKWDLAGDSVRKANFSKLVAIGQYGLWVNDTLLAYPIVITKRPYETLARASLKAFYFNRSGIDIDSTHGGRWARAAGHTDTVVYIHYSAADKNRLEGSSISSPGGWYDAGDYGKYTVNSGISTYTLLLSYELNKDYHQNFHMDIPESNNELPDILDETLYNLNWMKTMQDPNDGGVYHKLTSLDFDGMVMPKKALAKRLVVQKSTAATLNFIATMAYASQVLKNCSAANSELAKAYLSSALTAWKWAKANPNTYYIQPSDVTTGAYIDTCLVDEWFWAAAELYKVTGDKLFKDDMLMNYTKPTTPKWDLVGTLGIVSILTSQKTVEFASYKNDFLTYVNELLNIEQSSAYGVSLNQFAWGSNSDVANQGMLKLVAYQLTKDDKYKSSAQNDLDYLLGRNATGYCFVTGFGIKSPLFIHHRPSAADDVEAPVPGFLVGGPNTIALNDCGPTVIRSSFSAKSYVDHQDSYSTNEVAINWNAPLVFITTLIDAYDIKHLN